MMAKRSFPFDGITGKEIRNQKQPGYYPGYSTLDQQKTWDAATHGTVVERVAKVPPIRFFDGRQAELLETIIDRLIPQDDRSPDRTIPILPLIDERLYKNAINGFRYEDMPPDREAYHLGLQAIDEMARERFGQSFTALSVHRQELILKSIHDGEPDPAHPNWRRVPAYRFWGLLMEDCVTAYYAHPWAWDEIGYGGPAYPRGYMRLEGGLPEPWEKDEIRYEWNAPVDSVSELDLENAPPPHTSTHGHGGTH
ncbi:MAG: gluconate 2-dehydrogenase subunit 3 family protein [Acidobacteriaceae bacterium]|nr:gluconate 2-dehydrogenase subunit 3 family protein [Acidobacteriaceae bacterium]